MTWTSEHVLLVVGIVTLVVIALTTLGFRVIRKTLRGTKHDKFGKFLNRLDALYVLPALWILAAVSILYWVTAQIFFSYSPA